MTALTVTDQSAVEAIVRQMEDAWNAGDAARFAAVFSDDSDQVNIFGVHLKNHRDIEGRHDQIFKTIFAGSVNALRVTDSRYISANVVLAHIHSVVSVPRGPLQGELQTLASAVLRKTGTHWKIVTFHNTSIPPESVGNTAATVEIDLR